MTVVAERRMESPQRRWSVRTTGRIAAVASAAVGAAVSLELVRERSALDAAELALIAFTVATIWAFRPRERHLSSVASPRDHGVIAETSRELRSPITIARGHAEMLRSAHPQQSSHLKIIVDELDRLTLLTERMNILLSADDPNVLALGPVTIESVVVDVGRRWGTIAGRDWCFDCVVETSIVVDAARVTLGLDSLIENAIERTVDGDRIAVTAYVDGGSAVFRVGDSGPGITGTQVEALLSVLASGDESTLDQGHLNLQLRVARAVAVAHGGRLSLGGGAASGGDFTLHLPVSA